MPQNSKLFVVNHFTCIDQKGIMQPTLLKNNRRMADSLLRECSASLEMTDSLFTLPSRDELHELFRSLPRLETNEKYASHPSKEGYKVDSCSSFFGIGVLRPRNSVGGPGPCSRSHHFDPDEEITSFWTDQMNRQRYRLEIKNSCPIKTHAPKVITRVGSFAA
jgi:hypothetical protein